jgi:hypothetical protein
MIIKLNKKDRIELIATVILVIVFIVLFFAFISRRRHSNGFLGRLSPGIFSASPDFKYESWRNKGTPFVLDMAAGDIIEIKRDPFSFGSSGNSQVASLSSFSLKGIIWNPDKPSALINDQLLGVGEIISGYKVVQILQDKVILENEKSRLELKLNQ